MEWPTGLPPAWTAKTIIAADRDSPAAFALTPADDGTLLVDPLPNPGDEPGFTWGYRGTGPTTLYQALTRCAQRTWPDAGEIDWRSVIQRPTAASTLFRTILTTPQQDPLRLSWPQVQQWAEDDRATFGTITPRT